MITAHYESAEQSSCHNFSSELLAKDVNFLLVNKVNGLMLNVVSNKM